MDADELPGRVRRMEETGEPLRVADPRLLGRFTVRGRLAEHAAGTVYSGAAPSGGPVVLVALAPAAASDPAVRDRFAAAIAAPADRVLDAAPHGPPAWAALPRDADGPDPLHEARALLDAAGLTAGQAQPGSGPGFAPHWSPSPDGTGPLSGEAPPVQGVPPLPAGPARTRSAYRNSALVLPLAGLLMIFLALGGWIGFGYWQPSSPPAPPSPVPSKGGGAPAEKGPVAGPQYGEGEDTYHMALEGMPFEFDVPGGWGCLRSDKKPFDDRWLCIDEGGTFPASGSGAGGFVAVQECAAPCGDGERRKLRKAFALAEEDWRRVDAATMYSETEGSLPGERERKVRVALSRVFASEPGGGSATAVAVQLTGPPEQRETMQKLINEIYHRTS